MYFWDFSKTGSPVCKHWCTKYCVKSVKKFSGYQIWRQHTEFKEILKNLVTFKLCFHSMLGMWRDLRESPIGQWHISSVLSGPGAWTAWTLPDCNIWYQPRQTGHWSVLTEFFLVTCLITGQGINGCSLRTFLMLMSQTFSLIIYGIGWNSPKTEKGID